MVQGSHSLQHGVQGTPRTLQVSSPPLLFFALKEQQYFEVSGVTADCPSVSVDATTLQNSSSGQAAAYVYFYPVQFSQWLPLCTPSWLFLIPPASVVPLLCEQFSVYSWFCLL